MFPVTLFNKFISGNPSYILAFDLDDYSLLNVKEVLVNRNNLFERVSINKDLRDLVDAIENNTSGVMFHFNGSQLYVYFNGNEYPYDNLTKVTFTGNRGVNVIYNENGYIDISEDKLELFLKMLLKEIYEYSGKNIPVNLHNEIKELQYKLNKEQNND